MSLSAQPPFNRLSLLQKLENQTVWDVLVIGGGATGLGIAVDAASRGYSTLLLERADFAKGTSSRSTKLVHGGVRYLAQGNIPLVYGALKERGILLQNAPHVVSKQAFIIPCFSWSDRIKYLTGLKLYDALSGRWSFGKSRWLNKAAVVQQLPKINTKGLQGGVLYFDGQFDDARLAINLAQTAIEQGAVVLNYMEVRSLVKRGDQLAGVLALEKESGREYKIQAKAIFNATGVFADAIHQMDTAGSSALLKQSQGVHLVFSKTVFPATNALMIPKTRDGRVLFAIPWHNQVVVGTTDTPVSKASAEPAALDEEVDFIFETLNAYLNTPVGKKNIQAVFAGLRPLALPQKEVVSTKEVSRDHKIISSKSGLITIIGGKWTTYRKMAEEALDTAIKKGVLQPKACVTKNLPVHGSIPENRSQQLAVYGSDAKEIVNIWHANPEHEKRIHPNYPYTEAEVIWAVRNELACTVEDVLARRLRLLFLDGNAARAAAPRVAEILRSERNKDAIWEQNQLDDFRQLATRYTIQTHPTAPSLQS